MSWLKCNYCFKTYAKPDAGEHWLGWGLYCEKCTDKLINSMGKCIVCEAKSQHVSKPNFQRINLTNDISVCEPFCEIKLYKKLSQLFRSKKRR